MIKTADIWKKIVSKRNFDEKGYDQNEAAKIKTILNLPNDKTILEGLEKTDVSVEEFLKTFFEVNSSYTAMMNDLLNMFQEIGAKQTNHQLQISFEFQNVKPLTFDITYFKAQLEKWILVEKEVHLPNYYNTQHFWEFSGDINALNFPAIYDGEKLYCDETSFQFRKTKNLKMNELLNKYELFLNELIKIKTSGNTNLNSLIRDFWPCQIASQLGHMSEYFKDDIRPTHHQIKCISVLEDFINLCGFKSQTIHERIQIFEDYLNLPFWKKRYELYSVWIFKLIYDVIKTHNHKVHIVDGKLSFPFKETHLATFYSESGRNVFIYCEKRTPLNNPIGKGRSKNIQPDYSFFIEPLSNIKSSILEIECKQYKKSDNDSFARALIDYSNGRPNSQVFLVNHGEMVPEQIFDKAKELFFAFDPQRCKLFSSLNAASSEIEKLKEAIEQVLLEGIIVEKKSAIKAVLTWDEEPKDLDLAVYYTHSNHRELINYQNSTYKGIEFKEDIINGFGPEEITFFPLETSIYKFVVDDYHKTKKFSQSGAKVQLFVDEQLISTFDINIDTNDIEIWDVCEIQLDQIDDQYFTLRIETL